MDNVEPAGQRQGTVKVSACKPRMSLVQGLENMVRDIESGYFDKLMLTPVSRAALLLGHIISGALALVLAISGVYGLVALSVAQRTREIGIRVAMGARGREVLAMVVGQGLGPVLAGLGAGLLAAVAGGRVLASLLYGVEPMDPWTLVTVPVVLLAVAFLATALPAH
mgnify:CR=1 FL=1